MKTRVSVLFGPRLYTTTDLLIYDVLVSVGLHWSQSEVPSDVSPGDILAVAIGCVHPCQMCPFFQNIPKPAMIVRCLIAPV